MALAEFPFSLQMNRFGEELADNDGAGRISEEAAFGDQKGRDPEQMWRTLSSFYQMTSLNTQKKTRNSQLKNSGF